MKTTYVSVPSYTQAVVIGLPGIEEELVELRATFTEDEPGDQRIVTMTVDSDKGREMQTLEADADHNDGNEFRFDFNLEGGEVIEVFANAGDRCYTVGVKY